MSRDRRAYSDHSGCVADRDVIAVHSGRQLYGHLFGQSDPGVRGHALYRHHVVGCHVRHVPCETAHQYSHLIRDLLTPDVPACTTSWLIIRLIFHAKMRKNVYFPKGRDNKPPPLARDCCIMANSGALCRMQGKRRCWRQTDGRMSSSFKITSHYVEQAFEASRSHGEKLATEIKSVIVNHSVTCRLCIQLKY